MGSCSAGTGTVPWIWSRFACLDFPLCWLTAGIERSSHSPSGHGPRGSLLVTWRGPHRLLAWLTLVRRRSSERKSRVSCLVSCKDTPALCTQNYLCEGTVCTRSKQTVRGPSVGSHPHGVGTVTSRLGQAGACHIPAGLILSVAAYVGLPYPKHKSAFNSAVQVRQKPHRTFQNQGVVSLDLSCPLSVSLFSSIFPLRGHQLVAVEEIICSLDFFPV